jgi:hypothetical protein
MVTLVSYPHWLSPGWRLAVGGFLAVKGYNVSVECAGQRVTVHGRLWIRTINRADIIAMTEFLAISWRWDGSRR